MLLNFGFSLGNLSFVTEGGGYQEPRRAEEKLFPLSDTCSGTRLNHRKEQTINP